LPRPDFVAPVIWFRYWIEPTLPVFHEPTISASCANAEYASTTIKEKKIKSQNDI
jgi:hypothetical protein